MLHELGEDVMAFMHRANPCEGPRKVCLDSHPN
jgi:hypothetical protein